MTQRQEERFSIQCPIDYSGDLIDGKGTLLNLSPSGCGVRTSNSLSNGTYIHVFLYLPDDDMPVKIELAAVRWVSGYSVGLEFIRISREQRKRLSEYLNFMQLGRATWNWA